MMDKFRNDFKEDFDFLDWLFGLPDKECQDYLSKSDAVEGTEDSTTMELVENETIEDWVKKYNLHYISELTCVFDNIQQQ